MTSIIWWLGVDQRMPASLNVATDSRITWEVSDGTVRSWDHGKKVFCLKESPVLLAYAGCVLFPTLLIPSIVEFCDRGGIKDGRRAAFVVSRILEREWSACDRSLFGGDLSSIMVGWREGERMNSEFKLKEMSFTPKGDVKVKEINVSAKNGGSGAVFVAGSGRKGVEDQIVSWEDNPVGQTSRAMYWAFCDAVRSGVDNRSGGPVQIASLYREGGGKALGTVHNQHMFYSGAEIMSDYRIEMGCEFRNDRFERVDARTGKLMSGAQRQPKPNRRV